MTKRDIIKFLEKKQHEKKNAMQEDYFALREQLMQKTYAELGLLALIGKIQPLLAEACSLWNNWENEHRTLDYISFRHAYYTLSGVLNDYTTSEDATFKKIVGEDVKIVPKEVESFNKEYYNNLDRVDSTFITVIAAVKSMKTAKHAAIYLKELGFDLSELENPAEQVQTALMVPVDTRFLFVKQAA